MKGLLVSIIGTDCTNGGASSGTDKAVLSVDDCDIFESGPDTPGFVALEYEDWETCRAGYPVVRKCDGKIVRVKVVPVFEIDDAPAEGGMFGGNFLTTSDSRFPYYGPIPVFDRFE